MILSRRVPDGCAHLDLAVVEMTLTKNRGDIAASARELKVPIPALRRLTWARPELLEGANEEMELVIARAWGQFIEALYSDDPRRRMWASDKIMSSYLAVGHPLSPATRGGRTPAAPAMSVTFRWADPAKP